MACFLQGINTGGSSSQVKRPDKNSMEKKQTFMFYQADAAKAMQNTGQYSFDFSHGINMTETFQQVINKNQKNTDYRKNKEHFSNGRMTGLILENRSELCKNMFVDDLSFKNKRADKNN